MSVRDLMVVGAALCAMACGGPRARDEAGVTASRESDERAQMIEEAEAFVRAQGYADIPATAIGDEIVLEGIEGRVEDRHDMLQPHAAYAAEADGVWSVVFRYRAPAFAGRGRML